MSRKPTKEEFEEGKDRLDEISRRLGSLFGQEGKATTETGALLGGLSKLIVQVQALVEAGGELNKSGEFGDNRVRGVYGFSVKTATGEKGPSMEPFGNIHKDEKTGRVVVEEIREPMIDVFDETNEVVVVAEVPGIKHKDVRLELHEDIVTFSAERGATKYRKEVLLPAAFSEEKMNYACHNGILEIRFSKH
jgi:HSP20 family protein